MRLFDQSGGGDGLRTLRHGAVVFGCAILALIWGVFAVLTPNERQQAVDHAEQSMEILAHAYADVASMDSGTFTRVFASIAGALGGDGSVTLVGEDGVVQARVSQDGMASPGEAIGGTPLMEQVRGSAQGRTTVVSPFDGLETLTVHRKVPDFPVHVPVSRPLDSVMAGDGRAPSRLLGSAAVLSLIVVAGMLAGIGQALRLGRARRTLAATEALASRNARELTVALENMSQGIMMIDAQQNVAVINERCVALLGLPRHFLSSRPAFSEVLNHQWRAGEFGDAGLALEPQVLAFIQGGGVTDAPKVYERRRPNGVVLEVRSLALPDGGMVRTYTDVTERTAAASLLAEARDRAETAARARTAFLAMMSHEIRTPLNGVVGMASLLAGTDLDGEQLRYMGTLRDSAEHLLQVIDDVLDFSKLEADRGTREEVSFDLERTVESILAMVAPRAHEKGLFIGALVDPAIPNLVTGDSGGLRQVLLNLAGNGVKFTAEGSVVITADAEQDDAAGECVLVRFSVRDTGIGIAADAIPGLFQEFAQLDDSISRRFGGTGLGLAISKHLVERQGGQIDVSSAPGQGSTFSFTMPFRRAEGATRGPASPPLSGQAWAVVAPNGEIRAFQTRLLALAGARAVAAPSIGKLLLRTELAGLSGVILDASMGDSDLAGSVAALRAAAGHDLRVLSVAPLGTSRQQACAGVDAVLHVPLVRRELVAAAASAGLASNTAARGEPASRPVAPDTPARASGRILLAEDNHTNRLVLEALLGRLGFGVVAVENGRDAVERIASEPFDVVLMDLTMPVIDGFSAARAIRALPGPAAATPIVAVTANALVEIDSVRAAGMDALATKPITRERLVVAIDAAMAARPAVANADSARAAADVAVHASPAPSPEPPVVDQGAWDAIAEALDPATVGEILMAFVEDTETRIARMTSGAPPKAVARDAHALKSAAGTFGFARLQALATEIEAVAADPSPIEFDALLARLAPLFDEARAAIAPAGTGGADPPLSIQAVA
jgi:signal transduction histidine kinase/CheY-like chemotaxis protein/HPt (histidine-containing phosphotransfer) domain-containing protein